MGQVYYQALRNIVWLGPTQSWAGDVVKAIEAVWKDLLAETSDLNTFEY